MTGATAPSSGTGLLVYVPSLVGRPEDSADLLARTGEELGPTWTVRRWEHGISPFSREPMEEAARRLAIQVRSWAGDSCPSARYDEILLVGHSVGGILVRQAFLLDAGMLGIQGQHRLPWTKLVGRIVLLAVPNAGFRTERLSRRLRALYAVASTFGRFTVEQLRAGSPFITELRLRWVDAMRSMSPCPTVVQVLGDRDGLVTQDDSLDIEFMPESTHLDVPGAGHGDLVSLSRAPDAAERFCILWHAMRGELDPGALKATPTSAAPVYMLLHGIRTGRYASWVGKLATELTRVEPTAVVHAPSYGYFSAVDFAVPLSRKRNMRRFLDWYSRLYVTHNGSTRSFAGHSNGTYMLGRALLQVPAIRFDRVYLAGSVLPREFPWRTVEGRGQIADKVHSDRATRDWPVGWLCSALRGLGMRDIGTGGFTGFDEPASILVEHDLAFRGGHGAALTGEDRIHQVSSLLRGGEADDPPCSTPSVLFSMVSRVLGVVAPFAALAVAWFSISWLWSADGSSRVASAAVVVLITWIILRSA